MRISAWLFPLNIDKGVSFSSTYHICLYLIEIISKRKIFLDCTFFLYNLKSFLLSFIFVYHGNSFKLKLKYTCIVTNRNFY